MARLSVLVILAFIVSASHGGAKESFGDAFVQVKTSKEVKIDLRYATENNFMKKKIYSELNACWLHRQAEEKFRKAQEELAKNHPHLQFLVFDCLRPKSVQETLFAQVKGTLQEPYVANPKVGSIHNFGFAIDLSLFDKTNGTELDMGTPFDSFLPLAEPRLESKFLKSGKLTQVQIENRKLLRQVMVHAGFIQLENEWWHYDALPGKEVRAQYKIVE